ncbi:hypothetical protein [Phascolarctobacterium succinatutens]|uniref:hypothetical protein n=1 Tax=Phascolarctobacterium succinatutens TaxID=626940 RepID=UPI003079C0A5
MTGSVFNTAQLMFINHITGNTDNKQLADTCHKNILRNYARIRAGNNNRIRLLTVNQGICSLCLRNVLAVDLGINISGVACF